MTQTPKILSGRGRTLDLSEPKIMGILNVTPDSFSDGGLFCGKDAALRRAEEMVSEGAHIIDIGGESTRPGADPVSTDEEASRTVPVVRALSERFDVFISVDTSNPEVMRECAACGAHMWNDIRALRREGAVETARDLDVAVCLMHMQGDPKTMQISPHYENVRLEVTEFLLERAAVCRDAGIPRDHIVLDPGFGFGKSLDENYDLLSDIRNLCGTGYPVLSALSRKSMIGGVTGVSDPKKRVTGSVTGAVLSVLSGASIVRVHDVCATREALSVTAAFKDACVRGGVHALEI